jgi:hypothetical protein
MFRSFHLRALSVATLVGGVVFGSGCAYETGSEGESDTAAQIGSTQQALTIDPEEVVFNMAVSLAQSVAGDALTDFLFPKEKFDITPFVDAVDATVKAELENLVKGMNEQSFNGAARAMWDLENRFRTNSSKAATDKLYLDTVPVFATLNTVLAGVGQEAPIARQRAGTRLYALAEQLKISATMFRVQLIPASEKAEREHARAALRAEIVRAIEEFHQIIDEARNNAMDERLARVGGCYQWTEYEPQMCPGYTVPIPCPIRHGFTGFNDPGAQSGPIVKREDNDLPFCQILRADHLRKVEEDFANTTLNPRFDFERKMIDGWAAVITAIDHKPAPQAGRALSLDFLGGLGTGDKVYLNPTTASGVCPMVPEGDSEKYSGSQLLFAGVDMPAVQCTAEPNLSGEPMLDFGGFGGNWRTPINSGALPCPDGFPVQPTQIHGMKDKDDPLYYCWRKHVPGTSQPYLYGGAYSRNGRDGKASWVNPATGFASCPTGFTSTHVQGSLSRDGTVKDYPLVMCWKAYEPFEG